MPTDRLRIRLRRSRRLFQPGDRAHGQHFLSIRSSRSSVPRMISRPNRVDCEPARFGGFQLVAETTHVLLSSATEYFCEYRAKAISYLNGLRSIGPRRARFWDAPRGDVICRHVFSRTHVSHRLCKDRLAFLCKKPV
jgi:hypothetical protein